MEPDDAPLLERARELAAIADRLSAARSGAGSLLLIEGPAGIGKTRLVRVAVERARSAGFTVLQARGGELEQGWAFGVVRGLFEAMVRRATPAERHSLLAGAARLAAPVLGMASDAASPSDGDAFPTLHGLSWLTANLCERGPLLLAVDDAQWADEASLRFLVHLLRRADALPVLLMVAVRADEPGSEAVLLDALRGDPLAVSLRPAPLSELAAAAVVRTVLSPRADAVLCRAFFDATGGNPLLLRMLAGALREEHLDVHGAQRVAELAPQVVAASVVPRLRRLPADAVAFAGAVAVLGDRVELRHAAVLAGLGPGPATHAADALAAAGILAVGRPLDFCHPTVRRAVYESVPPAERQRAHRQAADLLQAEGAPADHVAAHLLLTEQLGDRRVVETLRAAGRHALARGAAEEAARYLRRALAEPPSPPERADVLFELGSVAARIDVDEAQRCLRQSLELAGNVRSRAAIALELARVMSVARDTRGAVVVLDRAVAEVGDAEPALRLRLEAKYISLARRFPATREAAARRLRSLADRAEPDSLAGCLLLAVLAADALDEEDVEEASRLASSALDGDHLLAAGETDGALLASAVLMSTDRLEPAWRAWDAELDRARRGGSLILFAHAVTVRACLAYRCGRLADAEADARLGHDVHREHRLVLSRCYSLAFLVGALVERGEVTAAAELLEEAAVPVRMPLLLDSRARLRAAQGRLAEAAADFLAAGEGLAARGTHHAGMLPWRSSAAVVLLRVGAEAEARRLAEEELAMARRLGVPRAMGIALRVAGLVRGGAAGLELLEESAVLLGRSAARLEEARALAEYGAALRRANRRAESVAPLRCALDLAVGCGAAPLAERVRQELAAVGVRPRRAAAGVDALTPSELRVARMAAEGSGNRAIAQDLFVTVKTVEVHLSHAYRKLGVPSRAELAAALGARTVGSAGSGIPG